MADFHTAALPKARKTHICPECGTTIQPGERYARIAGSNEGDFYSAIQCQPCHAFGERLVSSLSLASWLNHDEATYPLGDMLHSAVVHLEFEWGGPPGPERWPAMRDAMMALFDAFDDRERAAQKRDRELRKAAQERAASLPSPPQRYVATGAATALAPSLSGRN